VREPKKRVSHASENFWQGFPEKFGKESGFLKFKVPKPENN